MTLRFGTAGVRSAVGPGPDRLNRDTVAQAVTAIARHLCATAPAGGLVVVGGDARTGSAEFVEVACAVLAGHGFRVVTPGEPVPTPVVAAAVRSRGAIAGLQVTASHNPPADNGLKLYGTDGAQIVPPTDAEIESLLRDAVREGVTAGAASPRPSRGAVTTDPTLAAELVDALAARLPVVDRSPRVALTPLHGVGGEACVRLLAAVGVDDVHVVDEQFRPDPAFPTVASPNPERPETVARLLRTATRVGADLAIALDPDADRCAVGLPTPGGGIRMLDGDATGAVLADHLLRHPLPGTPPDEGLPDEGPPVVASSVVSSRLPEVLVPARGGRHVRTPTGFKWLVRARAPLRYAYEEALGHCVLPDLVADKDGLSAAALWCALAAGDTPPLERLAGLHREFGEHHRSPGSVTLDSPDDVPAALDRAAGALGRLGTVSGLPGGTGLHLDVPGLRVAVRPSGTEPLLKYYCEAWTAPSARSSESAEAVARLDRAVALVRDALARPGP